MIEGSPERKNNDAVVVGRWALAKQIYFFIRRAGFTFYQFFNQIFVTMGTFESFASSVASVRMKFKIARICIWKSLGTLGFPAILLILESKAMMPWRDKNSGFFSVFLRNIFLRAKRSKSGTYWRLINDEPALNLMARMAHHQLKLLYACKSWNSFAYRSQVGKYHERIFKGCLHWLRFLFKRALEWDLFWPSISLFLRQFVEWRLNGRNLCL